jgi:ParB family chromosome partitioning protein
MQTVAITPNAVPQEVPLSLLMESATNPRQHFEEDDLNELAETIRKSGVYQAILARPKDDRLEIVFGARRYRASQLAGRETIPALVREMSDAEVLEAQLVELSIVVKRFLSVFAGLHVVDISTTCGFAS